MTNNGLSFYVCGECKTENIHQSDCLQCLKIYFFDAVQNKCLPIRCAAYLIKVELALHTFSTSSLNNFKL